MDARITPSKRILSRAEEIEIIICYLAKIPIARISAGYLISRSGIHRVLKRHGISSDRNAGYRKERATS